MESTASYRIWCRNHYDTIEDGGVWAVPRSGLVFVKRYPGLVLTEAMPWMPDMPLTEDELLAYQRADFETHKEQFGAAGIVVVSELVDFQPPSYGLGKIAGSVDSDSIVGPAEPDSII